MSNIVCEDKEVKLTKKEKKMNLLLDTSKNNAIMISNDMYLDALDDLKDGNSCIVTYYFSLVDPVNLWYHAGQRYEKYLKTNALVKELNEKGNKNMRYGKLANNHHDQFNSRNNFDFLLLDTDTLITKLESVGFDVNYDDNRTKFTIKLPRKIYQDYLNNQDDNLNITPTLTKKIRKK